jgi:L-ribulose-5-phosphate 3-epimerase UlaE
MENNKTSFHKFMDATQGVKVELALADDIRIMINALNAQKSIDDEITQKTVQILRPLQSLKKDAIDRFQTNEKIIQSSKTKIQLANDLLKKAEQIAKELGVATTALNGYDEISKLIAILEKNNQRTAEYNSELKQVL